ncbi:L-type lectin-domain containing receptor kinase S.7-like [Triticum aestivum]|uniref:L-type lectin-domain containing receptor kinase S.7-like n=1 Tax=Triticum aestivum TaxID=4565 RepID=UPI001D007AF5|nr:L-type lectin-domain containing receptor kinase S.7-like [Triticum aestivum]
MPRRRIAMPPSCPAPAAVLLLLLVVAVPPAPSAAASPRHPSTTAPTTAFGRSSGLGNLTLLGSASMLPGQAAVSLTTNASDAGRALFSNPVRLLLPPPNPRAARAQASFSTRFVFRVVPSPAYGDGLAFIFTSSRTFVGAADGFLGLYDSTLSSSSSSCSAVNTVAVEFDTHLDLALGDPDANHVALDAGSIYSAVSASPGLDLKSGGVPITAWVQYDAPRRRLRAWLSHSASRKHLNPALSITVDFSGLLNDSMYVGFSASNSNKGSALHIINSWSFRTYWPRHTSSVPLAVSPPPPPTPLPSLPAHHHSIVAWLVGQSDQDQDCGVFPSPVNFLNGCCWTAYPFLKFHLYVTVRQSDQDQDCGVFLSLVNFLNGCCWTAYSLIKFHLYGDGQSDQDQDCGVFLSLVNFLNGCCWTAYSFLKSDLYMTVLVCRDGQGRSLVLCTLTQYRALAEPSILLTAPAGLAAATTLWFALVHTVPCRSLLSKESTLSARLKEKDAVMEKQARLVILTCRR